MRNTLTPIQSLALSKLPADKAARDAVEPGEYSGTVTVTVNYDLKVGEDYEQRIALKADPWTLLHVALSKLNGVTVESIVREALGGDLDVSEIKKSAQAAVAALTDTTMTPCKGKVTGKATVAGVMVSPAD